MAYCREELRGDITSTIDSWGGKIWIEALWNEVSKMNPWPSDIIDFEIQSMINEGILTETKGNGSNIISMNPQSRFSDAINQIKETVEKKNSAYGDSFGASGEFLKLLYPDGVKPEDYWKALVLVRIFDKMKRLATNNDPMGENPFLDIAGYAVLGLTLK